MHGYRPLARRPEIINRYHVQIVHLFKSNLGNEGRKSLWFSILTHRNGCVCFSRLRWIFRSLESIKGFCLFFSVYAGQCHSLEISWNLKRRGDYYNWDNLGCYSVQIDVELCISQPDVLQNIIRTFEHSPIYIHQYRFPFAVWLNLLIAIIKLTPSRLRTLLLVNLIAEICYSKERCYFTPNRPVLHVLPMQVYLAMI